MKNNFQGCHHGVDNTIKYKKSPNIASLFTSKNANFGVFSLKDAFQSPESMILKYKWYDLKSFYVGPKIINLKIGATTIFCSRLIEIFRTLVEHFYLCANTWVRHRRTSNDPTSQGSYVPVTNIFWTDYICAPNFDVLQ